MDTVLSLKKNCRNLYRNLSIRAGIFGDPEIKDSPPFLGGSKTDVSNYFHASSPVQDSFESRSQSTLKSRFLAGEVYFGPVRLGDLSRKEVEMTVAVV
jgi:hypothetical protein